jgi:hypothetical protein
MTTQHPKRHTGFLTIADVRQNCRIDPASHCWHWLGAKSTDGTPRVWTVDHERIEKRTMSGPKGLWNIAHGEAPRRGWLVYRSCVCADCMNPAHLAQAASKRDIFTHIARSGRWKGTCMEQRRANARLAQQASGAIPTAASIVLAIRAAGLQVTNQALATAHGISHTTVSRIRLGKSHRELLGAAAA